MENINLVLQILSSGIGTDNTFIVGHVDKTFSPELQVLDETKTQFLFQDTSKFQSWVNKDLINSVSI